MARKQLSSKNIPIIVAIIGALATIIAALIAVDFFSSKSHSPTISISSIQSNGMLVEKDFAPYDVLVNGIVSNAEGKYLYLIVVDPGGVKWIQPSVELISGDNYPFSEHAFLGAGEYDPPAQDKSFIIYAVVSDNGIYQKHDDVRALTTSEPIILVRRDLPRPTP